jgi:fatty acyl-CoA reductase
MIVEQLAGKRIAITGSTGFLGTALVERLLRAVPTCELVLLVRPGRRGAQDRVTREVLKNNAFDRMRADGTFAAAAARVTAIAGDVATDGLALDAAARTELDRCDIVIHSAATVSFDSPLDSAVEVNLLGPVRIVRVLNELAAEAAAAGRAHTIPHLVAVSTCYVAGSRKGKAPEELVQDSPFFVDVDWRREVDVTRRTRLDAETESRRPEHLTEFRKLARRELGAAGTPLLAGKTEALRNTWVNDQMVAAGRARASSLGFPDAYAFTKALGERALLSERGEVPVSIVRPSIIESAFAEPVPGWIRGFRMAEPVIISYARGLIQEFPGVPEGIIDVIPVDMVVAALIAVAARGALDKPDVVQIASGSVNPLRYGQLVDLVRVWFTANPIYDDRGQAIAVSEWGFPGRGRVQKQLTRAKTGIDRAERLLHLLPLRGSQAAMSANLEDKREQVERALGYVELYGAYAECEAIYGLDRLYDLWNSLDVTDQTDFLFDPRVIDWDRFVPDTHLPTVVEQARVKTTPGAKTTQPRADRLRAQVLAPQRQLAAFDLENTLIASNVVSSFAWLASRHLSGEDRVRFVAQTLAQAPTMLALDRADRSDFLRWFYRRYEHASPIQIDDDAAEMFSDLILMKSFPAAIRRVRQHRALGHRTLLITGALDFVVKPLAPLFDDIVAARLGTRSDGTYDGRMTEVPPTGETREQVLVDYAELHGIDLRESVAYADSASDLPMLEAVGFPVAVNPETKLASIARKRGWLVEDFKRSPGAPRRLLPLAPPDGSADLFSRVVSRFSKVDPYVTTDPRAGQR